MSQKNETLALVLSFIVTGVILGGGAWLFFNQGGNNSGNNAANQSNQSNQSNSSSNNQSNSNQTSNVDNSVSAGEKILIPGGTPEKEAAARSFASGNYEAAVKDFSATLAKNKNDPEALIYLNNAKIGKNKSYTIAVSFPIRSDPNSSQEILRGVAQAQNQVNQAGGVNGIPLKVAIADDNNKIEQAQAIAKTLVSNPEVLGVVGNFSSDVTLSTGKIYGQGQLVLISPTSTATQISGLDKFVFRTVPSDRFAGDSLARYMLTNLKKTKVAVFFNSKSDYSKSLKDVFTTAVFGSGGQVVKEFDMIAAGFDGSHSMRDAVVLQGAEVILLASNTGTIDQALQVAQANTSPRLPMLGGDDLYAAKTLQVGQQAVEELTLAVAWHILANPNADFPREANQLWGGEVNWRSAMAFDATTALIAALAKNPTRKGVQAILSSPNFRVTGAANEIKFLPSGDRNQAIQLVTIKKGTRTNLGYEFVPINP